MHLNVCWKKPSYAREDTKCISTCIDQTYQMAAKTQNVSQQVLPKPLHCQRGHKMHLNMCWPKPFQASKDTKYILTSVKHLSYGMPAKTRNLPQPVLTKPLSCQRGNKMYLKMYWPHPFHASEDKKCFSTCGQNPYQASEVSKCISTFVDQT